MLHGRFLVKQKKEIKTKKFLISSSQWLSPAVDLRLSTNRFIFHSGASQGKKNPSGWGVGPTNRPKGWLLIVHHQVGKERERGEEENQGPHRLFFFRALIYIIFSFVLVSLLFRGRWRNTKVERAAPLTSNAFYGIPINLYGYFGGCLPRNASSCDVHLKRRRIERLLNCRLTYNSMTFALNLSQLSPVESGQLLPGRRLLSWRL